MSRCSSFRERAEFAGGPRSPCGVRDSDLARPGTDVVRPDDLSGCRAALVAAVFALRSSPTPWHDAEPWLPLYGTLIDAGCLTLLWRLTRREGINLFDLVSFERTRFLRDVGLGVVLIPVYLAFILAGVYSAGWLVYGTLTPPFLFAPLPVWATVYSVLVFPVVWGFTDFATLLYLRLRRVIPFAIAHAVLDGASVLVGA